MKSKSLRKLMAISVSGLLALTLQAQAQPTDVTFGSLYGTNRATSPTMIEGDEYFWLCLDIEASQPSGGTHSYTLSSDIQTVGGPLLGNYDSTSKSSLESAITNIYGNHLDAILADTTGNGAARDFQRAVWALVHGIDGGYWTGTLTQTGIDGLNGWWGTADGFDYMLNSALTNSDRVGNIIYGTPVNSTYQPIMFMEVIPEPSSALLLGGGLIFFATRRRRAVR